MNGNIEVFDSPAKGVGERIVLVSMLGGMAGLFAFSDAGTRPVHQVNSVEQVANMFQLSRGIGKDSDDVFSKILAAQNSSWPAWTSNMLKATGIKAA